MEYPQNIIKSRRHGNERIGQNRTIRQNKTTNDRKTLSMHRTTQTLQEFRTKTPRQILLSHASDVMGEPHWFLSRNKHQICILIKVYSFLSSKIYSLTFIYSYSVSLNERVFFTGPSILGLPAPIRCPPLPDAFFRMISATT
ncbi:hypothetical protein SAMN05660648_02711 [Selenomonas ruminantium]|uniref:Uncharacterized protein n=1 Tax=Selenomonas ruminantium TaxID=971 RepID=A0A1H4A3Q9_SELRU|nr:hypothetical protein SAMN05660648_02711 [Selenomonas ruminantium]